MKAAPPGVLDILRKFELPGACEEISLFGDGHINDTYRSRWLVDGRPIRYIHQRINEKTFARPDQVMENILRVTSHISGKLRAAGVHDADRKVLCVVPAASGAPWARDKDGGWWRTYRYIEGTHADQKVTSSEQARLVGATIGKFQGMLSDLPPPPLHETIPAFHDMRSRYAIFDQALAMDKANRAATVLPELRFMEENRRRGCLLIDSLEDGTLPRRICHNDAKLNNILLDNETSQALCVVDLDTVMPGTVLFDFGDLVRSVATTAVEDEADLSKVRFDASLYEALLGGYLSEAGFFIKPSEKALLAEAGRNLAQIMALRFLTDFLEGDRYYKTAYPTHNLARCRNQIELVLSMDETMGGIKRITARELNRLQ